MSGQGMWLSGFQSVLLEQMEELLSGLPLEEHGFESPTGTVAMCALFETIQVFVPTARRAAV